MKLSAFLLAFVVTASPAIVLAQDSSNNGRGAGGKAVGPASENGDTSTGQTSVPGSITGRSANPSGQGTSDYNPPAMNQNAPGSSTSPGGMGAGTGAGGR
jgi:hypothetical protein